MKKLMAMAMATIMVLSLLAGCGTNSAAPEATQTPAATQVPAETQAPAESTADKIVIGGINDLTGSRSVTGNAINNGVTLAIEEINAAGGILGRQIEYIIYDNKNDGQETINAYTRLADVDKASAVITTDASGIFMSLIEVSTEKGVPVLGMPSDPRAVMDTEGTGEVYPYCFLTGQCNAPQQAAIIAQYVAENTDMKKAALFYDQSNAYAVAYMNGFRDLWTSKGGEITIEQTCNSTDQDFSTQLSKIKASGAEFICTPNPTAQLVIMVQQAAQLGLNIPYVGAQDMSDPFLSLLDDPTVVSKAYFQSSVYMGDPSLDDFCANYEARFGEPATIKAVNGYDSMYILKAAIEAAGSDDRNAIKNAMEASISNLDLLCTDSYTEDGTTHSPKDLGMAVYEITDGVLEYKDYLQP
ncbi:MAG: ABC transporter substrate-binding protein [Eubacteriales bacterium]|nr:ABC transporter substrate-binding protein [Eubacteriales bacterium]